MNKVVQNLQVEAVSTQNIKIKRNLEMKSLGTWTGTSEADFTNELQEMGDRISGIEDKVEEMDTLLR